MLQQKVSTGDRQSWIWSDNKLLRHIDRLGTASAKPAPARPQPVITGIPNANTNANLNSNSNTASSSVNSSNRIPVGPPAKNSPPSPKVNPFEGASFGNQAPAAPSGNDSGTVSNNDSPALVSEPSTAMTSNPSATEPRAPTKAPKPELTRISEGSYSRPSSSGAQEMVPIHVNLK
jgi:hypothetical protein